LTFSPSQAVSSYSVVVPCYASESTLRELVERIERTMDSTGADYEVVLVNDASPDNTWQLICDLAGRSERVRGFDLLFNAGQFAATICGLGQAQGEMVFTLDDDLQHKPEEMLKLIQAAAASPDADCFVGIFARTGRPWHRRLGTWLVRKLHTGLYGASPEIVGSSFRLMNRATAGAICAHRTARPMMLPLLVQSTARIVPVTVDPGSGRRRHSGYTWRRLAGIVWAKLLHGSRFVFGTAAVGGTVCSVAAGLVGLGSLTGAYPLSGPAALAVLVTFFAGLGLLLLALIGAQLVRITLETERPPRYFIKRSIEAGEPQSAPGRPALQSSASLSGTVKGR